MHDNVSGLLALERKEELLKLIAKQQERGEDGLEEEDRWLLEVNLDDLETTSLTNQTRTRRISHLKTGFLLHLTNNTVIRATLWPDTTWASFTPPRRRVALTWFRLRRCLVLVLGA